MQNWSELYASRKPLNELEKQFMKQRKDGKKSIIIGAIVPEN